MIVAASRMEKMMASDLQNRVDDGVAVHGFDIGGVDFLFHGFQISFDELVERNIKEGAEQEQTMDIGVALAGIT